MADKKTENKRTPKQLQGTVVSTGMQNTIVVRVEQKYAHPFYGKIIKTHKKYLAHCEDDKVVNGDTVIIEEGKPVSARKTFYFVSKVETRGN
ncbi:MAG: 30S ribosomal protein S17 [candidate division WS6 bacterium OLB20]|uniref:Small ribosomal subunit protein uS17 n=1 Tax=candidate division WS6 bacterium OLB20 TaxID=1617426 RepID=A0A136LX16_9BACT|nr:MAG: 30S ribosomal protein S17 [candidate division WS6 bacterium OLB20]